MMPIDHVEMFVPDRYEAARWYERVLGCAILTECEHWAADPRGPLMISGDGGSTKLALFPGPPSGNGPTRGFHRVAFRVHAAGFMAFLRRLEGLGLNDEADRPVTAESVIDHDAAWSIYFSDPYGHRLEVTTYDYAAARAALAGLRDPGSSPG